MYKRSQIIALVIVVLLPLCAFSKIKGKPIKQVQQIIEIPGATAAEVFVKANAAAVDVFMKSDCVIEYSDKDAGLIKGKFILSKVKVGGLIYDVNATITIESKDSKARITINNIWSELRGDAFAGLHSKQYPAEEIGDQSKLGAYVTQRFNEIIQSLTQGMATAANDDW